MINSSVLKTELHETEQRLLGELRTVCRGARASRGPSQYQLTIGQRIADTVATNMGPWRFIIIQSVLLLV
jgi:uncharacterized membrane protein